MTNKMKKNNKKNRKNTGKRRINKKGIFFTLTAILLMALILLISTYTYSFKLRDREEVISSRIDTINNFIKGIDSDLDREIYISGFRTILGMQDYMEEKGEFFNNSQEAFKEIFLYGKYGNETIDIMNDTSFTNWSNRMKDKAEELNIIINFTNVSFKVFQDEPWGIKINMIIKSEIKDVNGLAYWNYTFNKNNSISIIGFEDPLYTIGTYGKVSNIINKTPYEHFVIGNNTNNLLNHLNRSYYKESTTAPDFLMRFSNNLSNSSYGIESMVNVQKLIDSGLTTKTKSVVDYIYFGNRSTSNLCINNTKADPDMPSWFRLDQDDNHVSSYETSDISETCH